ncbi:MAG: hypothetical protein JXA54_04700 [Candidatus Heimdallarchaeota archaeon]|nr:hypothetical protein [Candidatus Heimdallarchaeota archaeon]
MKINILNYDEDNEITLEVNGEGHTFTNILREFLSDVKDVDSAGYYKEHPFDEISKIIIKAAPKRKIDKAFRVACKDLTKAADDFYKLLEKAV